MSGCQIVRKGVINHISSLDRTIRELKKGLNEWKDVKSISSVIFHKSIKRLKKTKGGYTEAGKDWKLQAH
jgi:hypothetical protein